MVKWGFRVMWIMSILFCITSVVLYHFELSSTYKPLVKAVLYVPLSLGLGGVLANILQLGVDQLADASSREIASFFNWITWLWFVSGIGVGISQSCLCSQSKLLGFLVLPAVITVAIATDYLFSQWLTLEAVSYNPLVLIKKILHYSMKNKYPRLRSAYVYWDDKHHSRIDVAKDKYGGPFTMEQVEDVKTFFRIISVIFIVALFVGMFLSSYMVYDELLYQLHDSDKSEKNCGNNYIIRGCFQRFTVYYSGNIILIIIIPIFELIYPFFKIHYQVSILKKVSYGMFFFSF